MWYGYEDPGVILLHGSKELMQLGCSKDMFVHLSTSTNYDFNALTPAVWKLWHC
jgi:hypothetical protein